MSNHMSMMIFMICSAWIIFVCTLDSRIRSSVLFVLLPGIVLTAAAFIVVPYSTTTFMDFLRNIFS